MSEYLPVALAPGKSVCHENPSVKFDFRGDECLYQRFQCSLCSRHTHKLPMSIRGVRHVNRVEPRRFHHLLDLVLFVQRYPVAREFPAFQASLARKAHHQASTFFKNPPHLCEGLRDILPVKDGIHCADSRKMPRRVGQGLGAGAFEFKLARPRPATGIALGSRRPCPVTRLPRRGIHR